MALPSRSGFRSENRHATWRFSFAPAGKYQAAFEPDLPSWPVPVLPGTAREQCATWAHAEIESYLMPRSQPIFATDPVTTGRPRGPAEGRP
jgi:hypothetical protein